MEIYQLTVGIVDTNAFVVEESGDAVIIDPGDDGYRFIDIVESNNLKVHAILVTHGHGDHIEAVQELREKYTDSVVYCHELDAPMLCDPQKNLSFTVTRSVDVGKPDKFLEDGQVLEFGKLKFEVRHVPGHTRGHVVFVSETAAFVGDTLFAGSIGRFDLPGGNGNLLVDKIKEKLLTLPDDMLVWPGHGPSTTIGYEKMTNPYLDPKMDLRLLGF